MYDSMDIGYYLKKMRPCRQSFNIKEVRIVSEAFANQNVKTNINVKNGLIMVGQMSMQV